MDQEPDQTETKEPPVSKPDAAAIEAGTAIYTPRSLRLYDVVVHGLSNPIAWRCPTSRIMRLYQANLHPDHLEAGAGTGYFLDRAEEPGFARLTLLDINRNCLDVAARRLARYEPELIQASLFEALPQLGGARFGSIGLTYILHCLPGAMSEKLQVIDNLSEAMDAETVLFGATILGSGVRPNLAARALLRVYNRKGVFDNLRDDLAALQDGLKARFAEVEIAVEGLVALFTAKGYGSDRLS